MGLLAMMSALVLALLISSAKTTHDTQSHEVTQMAADFIQLDRVLAHYGPETSNARALLYATVAQGLGQTHDRDRSFAGLRAVGCRCDFSGPGNGPAF
jgi:hypothetical protein